MDDGVIVIGTEFKPWQVKDFSVALREAITEAAYNQRVTVPEWLHAYFTRHGIDGSQVVLPRQALPRQTGASDLDLMQLAQLARALTPPDKDSAAMRLARSIVRERLQALQAPAAPVEPATEPSGPALAARKPQAALPSS